MTLATSATISRRAFVGSIFLALDIGASPTRIVGAQSTGQYTFAVLRTDKRTPEEPENTGTILVSRVDMGAGSGYAVDGIDGETTLGDRIPS